MPDGFGEMLLLTQIAGSAVAPAGGTVAHS
jgi:hypothetical protein